MKQQHMTQKEKAAAYDAARAIADSKNFPTVNECCVAAPHNHIIDGPPHFQERRQAVSDRS